MYEALYMEDLIGHINEYKRMVDLQKEVEGLAEESSELTRKIEKARTLPGEILQNCTIPIDGLTVENGIPLINGLPVSNLSEGEKLDLLIGNSPLDKAEGLDEEEKETIKANVLHILKENYGIEEEDFASAELEIVPAGKARDCGFDRSMILSYGQDDRVCAFTSLFAMLDVENAMRT